MDSNKYGQTIRMFNSLNYDSSNERDTIIRDYIEKTIYPQIEKHFGEINTMFKKLEKGDTINWRESFVYLISEKDFVTFQSYYNYQDRQSRLGEVNRRVVVVPHEYYEVVSQTIKKSTIKCSSSAPHGYSRKDIKPDCNLLYLFI